MGKGLRGLRGRRRKIAAKTEDVLDAAFAERLDLVGDPIAGGRDAREVRQRRHAAFLLDKPGNCRRVRTRRAAGGTVRDGDERWFCRGDFADNLLRLLHRATLFSRTGFCRRTAFRRKDLEGDRRSVGKDVADLHLSNASRMAGVTSASELTRARSSRSPGPKAMKGTGLRVWPRSSIASMLPWSAVITSVKPPALT